MFCFPISVKFPSIDLVSGSIEADCKCFDSSPISGINVLLSQILVDAVTALTNRIEQKRYCDSFWVQALSGSELPLPVSGNTCSWSLRPPRETTWKAMKSHREGMGPVVPSLPVCPAKKLAHEWNCPATSRPHQLPLKALRWPWLMSGRVEELSGWALSALLSHKTISYNKVAYISDPLRFLLACCNDVMNISELIYWTLQLYQLYTSLSHKVSLWGKKQGATIKGTVLGLRFGFC